MNNLYRSIALAMVASAIFQGQMHVSDPLVMLFLIGLVS
jgi:hypothetical protein